MTPNQFIPLITLIVLPFFSAPAYANPADAFATALQYISDANLRKCLQKAQAQHHWKTTKEVTQIKCHSKKISSIQGLEQFVEVTELSLFNNNIEHLQLPPLTKLRKLNIAKNPLTKLQLSHPALEELFVFSANLQYLHLNLPAATTIRANNNRIEEFSYQRLSQLNKLYLFNNELPTMDITRLPALAFLDVRQNPMPDELYDRMDQLTHVTTFHDGNAEDWQ